MKKQRKTKRMGFKLSSLPGKWVCTSVPRRVRFQPTREEKLQPSKVSEHLLCCQRRGAQIFIVLQVHLPHPWFLLTVTIVKFRYMLEIHRPTVKNVRNWISLVKNWISLVRNWEWKGTHSFIGKVHFITQIDIMARSLRSLAMISLLVMKRRTFPISWK